MGTTPTCSLQPMTTNKSNGSSWTGGGPRTTQDSLEVFSPQPYPARVTSLRTYSKSLLPSLLASPASCSRSPSIFAGSARAHCKKKCLMQLQFASLQLSTSFFDLDIFLLLFILFYFCVKPDIFELVCWYLIENWSDPS